MSHCPPTTARGSRTMSAAPGAWASTTRPIPACRSWSARRPAIRPAACLKDAKARYETAGNGWIDDPALFKGTPLQAFAIAERKDDYCAAAFVYCREPQAVPPADVAGAVRDLS